MFKPKIPKQKTLIKIIIVMILYMFIYDIFEGIYINETTEQIEYNKYEIENICYYPKFYDCETIIKIKNHCNYMQYKNKLNGCLWNESKKK